MGTVTSKLLNPHEFAKELADSHVFDAAGDAELASLIKSRDAAVRADERLRIFTAIGTAARNAVRDDTKSAVLGSKLTWAVTGEW